VCYVTEERRRVEAEFSFVFSVPPFISDDETNASSSSSSSSSIDGSSSNGSGCNEVNDGPSPEGPPPPQVSRVDARS
jgi:hypothetical protein